MFDKSIQWKFKAHVRLIAEMGDADTAANDKSLAILLIAEGRPEELTNYGLDAPPENSPWIDRAKVILEEERVKQHGRAP